MPDGSVTAHVWLVALALSAAVQPAWGQPQHVGEPAIRTADKLLECAAAQILTIRLLQEANQSVAGLTQQLSYFRLAGEAFSSEEYAHRKYREARALLNARMDRAMSEAEATRPLSVQRFADDLFVQLDECTRFQRANASAIRARLEQSGLMK